MNMTKQQIAAAEPYIRRSILDYKKLAPEVRKEVSKIARQGVRRRPSAQASAWLGRLPGYPFNKEIFTTVKSLEGREFPRLVITTEGPRRGPQEVSV